MHTGNAQVTELILDEGMRHLRIVCPANLVPAPGQYVLAAEDPEGVLPVSLFYTSSAPNGFIALAAAPSLWTPGKELKLRGPLGRGFALPASARRVVLVALDTSAARLKGLIEPALRQDAAVVLVCDSNAGDLPDEVEVQPLRALQDLLEWADFLALDVRRENVPQLREQWSHASQRTALREAQILIHTPVPCGGVAECGVCAVASKSGWKLACKDGPVFDWREL